MKTNLSRFTNQELVSKLKSLVSEEKRIGFEILEHLQEVSDRRLHLSLGFSSLFDYALRELGYSEAHAYRLSSAVRVVKELPEVKEKIQEGKLTLTHVSQAASFFKKEAITKREEKKEILEKLECTSKRESERILIALSPERAPQERTRAVAAGTEVKLVFEPELMEKLERLKSLLSHQLKDPNSLKEVIEKSVDIALEKLEPKQKAIKPSAEALLPPGEVKTQSRYIPKAIRARIWKRAEGQCEYQHGGTRCASRRFLQFDHAKPYAKGGQTRFENLRLLCQSHNQFAAIQAYGVKKMGRYLGRNPPSTERSASEALPFPF